MLETAAFTDKVMVAGVFPLDGVTVKKLPPVLGTKQAVKGTLVPDVVLVTWMLRSNREWTLRRPETLNDSTAGGKRNGRRRGGHIERHWNIERTVARAGNDHSYYTRVSALRNCDPLAVTVTVPPAADGSKPAAPAQDG